MSRRLLFVALVGIAIIGMGQLLFLVPTAIWLEHGRLGGITASLGVAGVVAGFASGIWNDVGAPDPLPSRKVRRQLKKERERIEFDRRLRDLEREAGL